MLRLAQVQARYGKTEVLKKIDLEVRRGELVTLLGANGAGKSTTLRAISGLIAPTGGTIEFLGREIHRLKPRAIVKLGIAHCPEGRKIWPEMTVEENLQMGAYSWFSGKRVRQEMDRIFDNFAVLKERRGQLAGTLSGGEQQMLAIGRALMARPALLLLDEPSLGLAPLMVERTAAIIREIHRGGTTVLLVEQNLHLALRMADRGYVMEIGRIVLTGAAGDLLGNEHVKKAYLGG
jgi:branched-chain amino acid transport system ATP-binding protein